MKFPRMLAFAAFAAALLVLTVAGTAAATTLTGSGTTLPSGTTLEAAAEGTTTLHPPIGDISCGTSTLSGKTSNAGGSSETVSASVSSLTFSECNAEVVVVEKGSLEFHTKTASADGNGTLTSSGTRVTVTFVGFHCIFSTSSTDIGTVTGSANTGATATLDIAATIPRTGGRSGAFCGTTAQWTGSYKFTSPDTLNVDGGGGGGGKTSTTTTTSLSGESKSGAELTVNEGSKAKDTATLSGTNAGKATGTVKYKVYADKECKELVTSAGEVTVTSGSVPASEEKELEAGRVYYWQAEYSGDSSNEASKSTCGKEVLTVKASTSLATSLSGESKTGEEITVNEGSKAKDTATLSGTRSASASGKVKFKAYKDKECKELASEAGEGSLSEGKANSEEKALEAGAAYYWQAEYAGDSLHQASTSGCGKEVLTVKAATSLATSLSGEAKSGEEITILEGSKAKDSATLSGTRSSTATGKAKYKVYADKECKELVTNAGEVTVSGGSAPASEEKALEAGRIYYWQVSYEGDSLHQTSTSTCGKEILAVKATTSISTSLSGEAKSGEEITVNEGSKAKDTATLSGTRSASATGKVKFKAYKDKECKELASEAGEGNLSEGKANSEEKSLEAGAIYYWQAEYPGDSLHQASTSTCGKEVLAIKAATSLTTLLFGGSVEDAKITVPDTAEVIDTSTLAGTNADSATGSVEYLVYADSECDELVTEAGEFEFEDAAIPASEAETVSPSSYPGVYYWQAVYSGDSLHQPSTSICGSEIAEIKVATSASTVLAGEGHEGDELEIVEGASTLDQATLSGAGIATATGKVTYAVYADPACEELVSGAGEATVEEGSAGPSEEETLPAGTYFWLATYSGNGQHSGATSSCGSEILIVTPRVTTSLSGEGETGPQIQVLEGAGVTDLAELHGETVETATGKVTYAVYADSDCEDLVTEAGDFEFENGEVPVSEEEMLSPGIYYWQAVYSGDKSHPPAESKCGTEIAQVMTPTSLTTELEGGGKTGEEIKVNEGTEVTDTATLTGSNASSATGFVEYNVYSDSECKDLVALADTVDAEGEPVPASAPVILPAGTYYWQAVYAGDGLNQTSTSPCGAEIEVVTAQITLTLTGEGHTGEKIDIAKESPVSGQAALTGELASTASGTIKYKVYADGNCTKLVTKAGEFEFGGSEKVPASEEKLLTTGIYWWQAEYFDDEENPPISSTCELVNVQVMNSDKYAALGDSFSAGQGAGEYYSAETDRSYNKCHRSPQAWPARFAEAVYGTGGSSPTFTDEVFERQPRHFIFRACNGAVIENLWSNRQGVKPGESGQEWEFVADPLPVWERHRSQDLWLTLPGGAPNKWTQIEPNPDIGLVTFTIGGNDAGFYYVIINCLQNSVTYTKQECMEVITEYEAGVTLAPHVRKVPSRQEGIPSIGTKLPIVLDDIHAKAPNARIWIPLYPKMIELNPRNDINLGVGLMLNNSGPGVTVAEAMERYISALNQRLVDTVATWAKATGVDARVIPWTISSLKDHRLGDSTSWVHGLVPFAQEESLHPTCFGNLAMAEDVAEWFGLIIPSAVPCTE